MISCWSSGWSLSCSSVFTMFPTDRGMCCSFNKQMAEDMFNEGKYRDDKNMVPKLREFDSHLFIVMERFHATYSPSFFPTRDSVTKLTNRDKETSFQSSQTPEW